MVALSKDFLIDPVIAATFLFFSGLALIPIIGTALGVMTSMFAWVLGIAISAFYTAIFVLWSLLKSGRAGFRRSAVRLVIAFCISLIPLLRFIIPEMALAVWFIHRKEVEQWKKNRAQAQTILAQKMKREEAKLKRVSAQFKKQQRAAGENLAHKRAFQKQRREVERIRKQHDLLAEAA